VVGFEFANSDHWVSRSKQYRSSISDIPLDPGETRDRRGFLEDVMTKTKVLVAGATGYLGGNIVRALHGRGYWVRALARKESRLGDNRPFCDEVVEAEATNPGTLNDLVDGAKILVSSLGKHDFKRKPTARQVDYQANLNLLQRAVAGGVEHVVFVSVFNGGALRERGIDSIACREDVVDAIKASGLTWTIIRPTGFFNDMKDFFHMAAKGTGWVIGDGAQRINPIHGADLADFIGDALDDPRSRGQERSVGGPDTFTFREILELAFDALRRKPKVRGLPFWLLNGSTPLVGLVNPFVADLMRSVAALSELGAVAPPYGTHHLADLFLELAAK